MPPQKIQTANPTTLLDHFTGIKHGDTQISKGPPLQWLDHCLAQYKPQQCKGKYVHLDQGGELFNHPEVWNLFKKNGSDILPTGAENYHQNGPVEQRHCTHANTIRALLVGGNLHIKFWPYAFYHALHMSNPNPTHNQPGNRKSRKFLQYLYFWLSRVWVCPPRHYTAKLKPNLPKSVCFLGTFPTPNGMT